MNSDKLARRDSLSSVSVGYQFPKEYHWVVERGLFGFDPFTSMQPWYFLREDEIFEPTEIWPHGPSVKRLVAFSRRQDCDDLACFCGGDGHSLNVPVVVVQGWWNDSYKIISSYEDFWGWLKSVIDDIAEVALAS